MWRQFRDLDISKTVLEQAGVNPGEFSYGETPTVTLTRLLALAELHPGARLVDLGSGRGLTLLAASLLGYRAAGVEKVSEYVLRARRAARDLRVQVDLREADLITGEWPDGDLYLVNSTAFPPQFRTSLAGRLAQLPPASLVATYDWQLAGDVFEEFKARRLPVTWGTVLCRLYRRF